LPDGPLLCNCGHRSRFAKEHPLPVINPYGDTSDDEALLLFQFYSLVGGRELSALPPAPLAAHLNPLIAVVGGAPKWGSFP
jgi:hypothetical protein